MATLTSPTLQQLLASVRMQLKQPNPNNSNWSNEELTLYINEGIRIYFTEVLQGNEGLFTTQTDLNIVTNTETVALPSDFFQVKALYKKVSNGYEILSYRNNQTESYSTQGGTSGESYSPYYYFRGNNLVLRPVPNFSETAGLRLEYAQFPETLVNGGDALTGQIAPIFRQVIEAYALYKSKLVESMVSGQSVHKPAEENLAGILETFRESVQPRSKNPTAIIPFNPEG